MYTERASEEHASRLRSCFSRIRARAADPHTFERLAVEGRGVDHFESATEAALVRSGRKGKFGARGVSADTIVVQGAEKLKESTLSGSRFSAREGASPSPSHDGSDRRTYYYPTPPRSPPRSHDSRDSSLRGSAFVPAPAPEPVPPKAIRGRRSSPSPARDGPSSLTPRTMTPRSDFAAGRRTPPALGTDFSYDTRHSPTNPSSRVEVDVINGVVSLAALRRGLAQAPTSFGRDLARPPVGLNAPSGLSSVSAAGYVASLRATPTMRQNGALPQALPQNRAPQRKQY